MLFAEINSNTNRYINICYNYKELTINNGMIYIMHKINST